MLHLEEEEQDKYRLANQLNPIKSDTDDNYNSRNVFLADENENATVKWEPCVNRDHFITVRLVG